VCACLREREWELFGIDRYSYWMWTVEVVAMLSYQAKDSIFQRREEKYE